MTVIKLKINVNHPDQKEIEQIVDELNQQPDLIVRTRHNDDTSTHTAAKIECSGNSSIEPGYVRDAEDLRSRFNSLG